MVSLADTEDALIADMTAAVSGVKTIATHEKEFDKSILSALLPRSPFVLIRYGGTDPDETERHADGSSGMNGREFYLSIGAESLRTRKEAQRGAYDILDAIRVRYDGLTLTTDSGEVTLAYKGDRLLSSEDSLVVYVLILGWSET